MCTLVRSAWCLVLLVFLLVAGCGERAGKDVLAPMLGPPPGAAEFAAGLPAPAAAYECLSPPRSASAIYLQRCGCDFETGLAQRCSADNFDGLFTPDWADGSAKFDKLAYATYRFNLDGNTGPHTLRLTWGTLPADFADVWIGFSEWAKDRWAWYAGTQQLQVIDLGFGGFAQYTHPTSGDVLVAIVLTGTDQARLRELLIGPGLSDDWTMYGHDRQHTHSSPYQGPTAPSKKWSYAGDQTETSSPAVGPDGTVYATWGPLAGGGSIHAINPDGTLRWSVLGNGCTGTPALAADGTVYATVAMLSAPYNVLYAFNADGSVKWAYTPGPPDPPYNTVATSSPVIAEDGNVYFAWVNNNQPGVQSIGPDGMGLWTFDTPEQCSSTPAIAADGMIYVGCNDGMLYAIKPNGNGLWTFNAGTAIATSPAIGPDGVIYFGCQDGALYAVNTDGTLHWSYATGGPTGSPAVDSGGGAYFISGDNHLYALNADGSFKWKYNSLSWTADPAVDANGVVYSSAGIGAGCEIVAISPDGVLLWSYHQGSDVGVAMPAIGGCCTLYVGCGDGSLLALGPN